MKKNGRSEYTINFVRKALELLNKNCKLDDPESVKCFLVHHNTTDGYKKNLVHAYEHYLKYHNLTWERPKYYFKSKLPKIPLESKIDMIISSANKKLALQLKISKETGLRPIELVNLKVKDVDFDRGIVSTTTAKHGNPRALKLKNDTLDLLRAYIYGRNLGLNDRLFNDTANYYSKKFREARNKLAKKLNDSSIRNMRLYDLRHYFATMLYNKSKDILFTKQQMGHRKLETTLLYVQLINFENDEFTVKIGTSLEECTKLLEAGFEYITDYEGKKIFRKRK